MAGSGAWRSAGRNFDDGVFHVKSTLPFMLCHSVNARLRMKTDTGQVFRLEDYRPSDYLIPETHLIFRLSPDRTRVLTELTV